MTKAATSNSTGIFATVSRIFNSTQDLLDNGLKKIEDFL